MTTDEPHLRTEPPREETWARHNDDAIRVLNERESPSSRCRQSKCRAPIWWGMTHHNKRCPFDIRPDGIRTATSHWRTCRDRPPKGATNAAVHG